MNQKLLNKKLKCIAWTIFPLIANTSHRSKCISLQLRNYQKFPRSNIQQDVVNSRQKSSVPSRSIGQKTWKIISRASS